MDSNAGQRRGRPFLPRLGLSRINRFPCFRIGEAEIRPDRYAIEVLLSREFTIWHLQRDTFLLKHRNVELELRSEYVAAVLLDWRNWPKRYLPPEGVRGKTVLDVGAGCGESAWFYLLSGARRVVCIEPDQEAFSLLLENISRNGWETRIEAINQSFGLQHLDIAHDFAKLDCEGAEVMLLRGSIANLGSSFVVELHRWALRGKTETLAEKLGRLADCSRVGKGATFLVISWKK